MPASTKSPATAKKQPANGGPAKAKKTSSTSNNSSSPSGSPTSRRTKARDLADKENAAEESASSPATKKKAASRDKVLSHREKAKALEARVERLTQLLEKETAERKKLERASHAPTAGKKKPKAKIPAPGTSKFCLRDEMGLADKPKTYKSCQRAVRRCVDMADLDHTLHMKKQDVCALAKVYKAARSIKPYLKRFEHNWATYEFIKMLLRNRRQHSARRDAQEGGSAESGDDGELSEGDNNEQGSSDEDEDMDEDENGWESD